MQGITTEATKTEDIPVSATKIKQSTTANYEFLIPEVRKIIKQGKYQKAFFMLDQYFGDAKKIGTVAKVKMCRRLVITLVMTTYNSLNKSEIRHPDELLKRLEVCNNYIRLWQQSLCNFIVRTDPKYEQGQGGDILAELSGDSDEEKSEPMVRKNSRMSVRLMTNSPLKTNNPKYDKQSNLLVQILKHQDTSIAVSDTPANETSFTDMELSNNAGGGGEELSSSDLNASFHLDEFYMYYLLHMMNWGLYYKRLRNWNTAFKFLQPANSCSKSLESSLNPNLIHACAKVRVPLGSLYMEFDRNKEAHREFEEVISLIQIELSMRFNRAAGRRGGANTFASKVKKAVRLLINTLLLCAKNYELQDNYSRIVESYRMAWWFCRKFLPKDDELYRTVQKVTMRAKEMYGKHLEEIGEMERIIAESNPEIKKAAFEPNKEDRFDSFGKLQESLYKKFNYHNLNQMRLPVKISGAPPRSAGTKRSAKSEYYDGREDTTDVNSEVSGIRTTYAGGGLQTTMSQADLMTRTQTEFETDQTTYLTQRQKSVRKKTEDKLKGESWLQIPPEKWKLLDRQHYTEPSVDRIKKLKLDESEEREYIQMLNRNIQTKRPVTAARIATASSTTAATQGYIDIDSYLKSQIESKIIEDKGMKHKPQDFPKIVRNYVGFIKDEDMDSKVFKHSMRVLSSKGRENLGEQPKDPKYINKATTDEKRSIDTTAFFVNSQVQSENLIQSRMHASKSLAIKPKIAKSKFVSIGSFVSPKNPTFESPSGFPESPARTQRSETEEDSGYLLKPKLSDIILKHKNTLNLKTVAAMMKENARRPKEESQNFSTQATEAGADDSHLDDRGKEEDWKKMTSMVKDRIAGMMEDIEKDSKNDDIIKRRITYNKPIFQAKKQKEKFLKNGDELASSTLLTAKRDAMKKTRDFATIIKQHVEEKRRERAQRKKPTASKITFTADLESPAISKRFEFF